MYAREIGGETFTLGVSGSLWKDALIMFDRETESLWTQVTGEALRGPKEGERLELIPSVVTTWGRWRQEHPETLVLVRDPGLDRSERYQEYDRSPDILGIFGTVNPDERAGGKEMVLGVAPGVLDNVRPVAYRIDRITILDDVIGDTPVVVVVDRDEKSARIFRRTAGGRELHFQDRPGKPERVLEEGTGTTWDLVAGLAVEGDLAGARLEPVRAIRAFWFAWAAFYPASEVRPIAD